ncbi:transcriptional regulator [Kroppenstedtia guangzhouensis]|uniref:Transcriptional regulator n=1 Tax=Kroppenstedtia guangzhouensis TaxID=1274356 RepID=A0ABQ1GZF1_9BACL|nr:metalloregulator ArsR/SmtB family transcription factor [Kroppenstedtia guangzhouensis]GGA52966.1 transcriptional regulator [Kroppenstedtia guangzhouensis]
MTPQPARPREETCEIFSSDEEKVMHLKEKMKETDPVEPARLFKGLGDETRFRIAYALYLERELCVCDVAAILSTSVATASHHLRLMKSLGLTRSRKEGKMVYYSLDDDHVRLLVKLAIDHAAEGLTEPSGEGGNHHERRGTSDPS